jgi:hypothetical protein
MDLQSPKVCVCVLCYARLKDIDPKEILDTKVYYVVLPSSLLDQPINSYLCMTNNLVVL